MKVSIIVPVFNEKKTIAAVISKLKGVELKKLGLEKEIIAVNDASTDETKKILSEIPGIKVLNHSKNRGKGAAIKTGIANSDGEIILIQDADMEYNPKYIPPLLKPILEGETEVSYGSRFIKGIRGNILLTHELGNRFLSFLTSVLFGQKITDMETGYKAFKRSALSGISLKANRFDFEPEITAKLLKKGFRIREIPIIFYARSFKEGKKITWRDGITAMLVLFKYRLSD